MTSGIINRLSVDYVDFARLVDVQRVCRLFDWSIERGETRIACADMLNRVSNQSIAINDYNLAVNALRRSGAIDLVIGLPKDVYPNLPEARGAYADVLLALGLRRAPKFEAMSDLVQVNYEVTDAAYALLHAQPTSVVETRVNGKVLGHVNAAFDIIDLLSRHMLEPTMNRIDDYGFGRYSFRGNFRAHSHAFSVDSNDPAVVVGLAAAMHANRSRKDYVEACDFHDRAASDYLAMLEATGNRDAFISARSEVRATRPPRAGEFAANAAPAVRKARP